MEAYLTHYPRLLTETLRERAPRPCPGVPVLLDALRRERDVVLALAGAALAMSVGFFLLSNFAVWLVWNMYPHTLDGLAACYAAALPFFGTTLAGDALYTGLLFGLHALAVRARSTRTAAATA